MASGTRPKSVFVNASAETAFRPGWSMFAPTTVRIRINCSSSFGEGEAAASPASADGGISFGLRGALAKPFRVALNASSDSSVPASRRLHGTSRFRTFA